MRLRPVSLAKRPRPATCKTQYTHKDLYRHINTPGPPTCSTSSSSGTRVISGAPYFRSPRSNLQGNMATGHGMDGQPRGTRMGTCGLTNAARLPDRHPPACNPKPGMYRMSPRRLAFVSVPRLALVQLA